MRQSKAMRAWGLIYPVCMYYAITTAALFALDFFLPPNLDIKLFRQLLTSLAALPYLIITYRQDPGAKRRPAPVKSLAVMCLVGACFAVACNNLLGFIRITDYSPAYAQAEQTFYTGRLLLEIAALVIVIPVTEELLYRGIVYKRSADWLGENAAMVLSAAIFGLVHMNLAQFVYATAFGVLLAYFARQGGTVLGAVFAHMAANLTSVLRAETKALSFLDQGLAVSLAAAAALFAVSAAGIAWIRRHPAGTGIRNAP